MPTFNIYCDESCHLENDHQKVMVLGAVWCPLESTRGITQDLRQIKINHGLPPNFEVKWTKVSPAGLPLYLDWVNYFFDTPALHFRALVVPDKSLLNHSAFAQTHNDFYYKMYFDMLKIILSPRDRYRIYVDIKDTRGGVKIKKLRQVLSNNIYDFSGEVIERIQLVRSHELEILPLADLLIGALAAKNRQRPVSSAKQALIDLISARSGYSLNKSTLFREEKVNLFCWQARKGVVPC
jgi:hypothetical protein